MATPTTAPTTADLVAAGFAPEWADTLFQQLGTDALKVVSDAFTQGLSPQLIVQAIETFGLDGLRLLVAYLKWKLGVAAGSATAVDTAILTEGTISGAGGYLTALLVAFLKSRGPELSAQLLQMLINVLQG